MKPAIPSHPPLQCLLLALALSGCAVSKVKGPVRISERITLEEGYRFGTLQYAEDEMKQARDGKNSFLGELNPAYQDTNLNIYAGQKTKRLYFDNAGGSKVYLMKILHGDRTIQECDEPEYEEKPERSRGGWVYTGPGQPMAYTGPLETEQVVKPVHHIRCILKQVPDTVGVELMDPDGLYARYRVILKD